MQETPQERISKEIQTAMKSGDRERLSALRMLLTEIQSAGLRGDAAVDEAGFQALVRRTIKQRRESAESFKQGNRPELAAKEEREAEILGGYLPRQASEEEVRQAVQAVVAELAAQGAGGPGAIGAVMKASLGRLGGSADGATVSRIARELLQPR
jgi:uncharacterized protein YqeY